MVQKYWMETRKYLRHGWIGRRHWHVVGSQRDWLCVEYLDLANGYGGIRCFLTGMHGAGKMAIEIRTWENGVEQRGSTVALCTWFGWEGRGQCLVLAHWSRLVEMPFQFTYLTLFHVFLRSLRDGVECPPKGQTCQRCFYADTFWLESGRPRKQPGKSNSDPCRKLCHSDQFRSAWRYFCIGKSISQSSGSLVTGIASLLAIWSNFETYQFYPNLISHPIERWRGIFGAICTRYRWPVSFPSASATADNHVASGTDRGLGLHQKLAACAEDQRQQSPTFEHIPASLHELSIVVDTVFNSSSLLESHHCPDSCPSPPTPSPKTNIPLHL